MIGKKVSHYRIIEELGRGGMGLVYKAEDTKLNRAVALKFLPPELTHAQESKERFIREAHAASALEHDNICTIHEINETDDGQLFIVMACYEGQTLKEKVKDKRLKTKEASNIITQIAKGLQKAHEKGIVHRDIKPANIFITDDGSVKILDFGLAKLAGKAQLTKDSSTLGTVAYMSPEQLQGKKIDERTDIWSLGVILYEMLTGELPFKGDYEQAITYSILNDELKLHDDLKTGISENLIEIVNGCLQKNPTDRYKSIREFLDKLENFQKENNTEKSIKKGLFIKKNIFIAANLIIILLFTSIFILSQSGDKKEFDSIAVLPLKNLSGNPEQEYFSDGMTEALITELSKLKSLKVISRTSIMQFKNTEKTLPEIADELNVNVLVEGSALIIGDQVKITAQLIDAEKDQHLWAEDYVRDLKDVLLLHKEVANMIALQVGSTLSPEERLDISDAKKVNPKAYEAYLQGRFYLYKLTKSEVEQAIQFFHIALEYQQNFALAYAALAEAYNMMSSLGWISSKSGWLKSKEMAQKALNLDNNIAEAHTMLADVKYIFEWDWKGAETEFKKAIEINPYYSTGRGWYAVFLSATGRHEEAVNEIKIALELDPLFYKTKNTAAIVYMFVRQYENAEEQLLELIKLDADIPLTHFRLGLLYLIRKRFDDAIIELEKSMDLAKDSTNVTVLAQIYALKGNKIKARQILNYWLNSNPDNIYAIEVALLYLSLGEKEKAFDWLKTAYDLRDWHLFFIKVDPRFDPIRNDKRYIELLNKIGLNP